MNTLTLITTTTPDSDFHLIADTKGVVHASGFGLPAALQKRLPIDLQNLQIQITKTHPYQKLVTAYYTGDQTALAKIPHSQSGTNFQNKVWQAMAAIPYGQTVSYKQLAELSGNPMAIRAAGTVCGFNKLILLVPCHRVLKSDGGIGSYLYGPEIKESLLQHEGAY